MNNLVEEGEMQAAAHREHEEALKWERLVNFINEMNNA